MSGLFSGISGRGYRMRDAPVRSSDPRHGPGTTPYTWALVKHHRSRDALLSLAVGLALTACASGAHAARAPEPPGRWVRFRHVPGVVDLAGPRADGSFTVAAAGRLFTLSRDGVLRPFARGPGGYSTAIGPEPYITLATGDRVAGTRCSFRGGTIFALEPGRRPGVIQISADGRATRFVSLPGTLALTGIAFDSLGHFGHKLLVTARNHNGMTVLAIDCAGGVHAVTAHAPAMEGGIAVAPASFGRYGGDLVAPNETTGRVFAIAPDGAVVTLAVSGRPHGGDIGVESAGFVPAQVRRSRFGLSRRSVLQREQAPGHEQHPAPARPGAGQGGRPPG